MVSRAKKSAKVDSTSKRGATKKPSDTPAKSSRLEKVKVSIGILILILAVLLLVSFISFFYNGVNDQSTLHTSLSRQIQDITSASKNEGGHIGAYFSDMFINRWVGLGAFFLVVIFFFIGTKLAFNRPKKVVRKLFFLFISMFWLSIFLGMFVADKNSELLYLSGRYGFGISRSLIIMLGRPVTFLVILFLLFVILISAFSGVFPFIKDFVETRRQAAMARRLKKAETKSQPQSQPRSQPRSQPQPQAEAKAARSVTSSQESAAVVDVNNQEKEAVNQDLSKKDHVDFDVEDKLVAPQSEESVSQSKDSDTTGIDFETATAKKEESEDFEVSQAANEEQLKTLPTEDYDPRLDLSNFKFPSLDFLVEHQSGEAKVTEDELLANKNKIVETLKHYKIEIVKIKATIGPTITLYEIVPAPGVRISKIKGLEDDIALSLAALGIRIIAPIPGRGTIGIEVPNQNPEVVSMRSIIASKKYQTMKAELPLALGKTISNETFCADLAKMPHALVAGATGQGKSVGMNAIITSLLYKKHPAELKFVMIDPKKVELSLYSKIERHYLAKLPNEEEPIITDVQKVKNTLNSLNIEMDTRYDLLKKAGSRNIKEYNAKFISRRLNPENGHRYLPYIVVLIDEFADLIMTAGKEIELPIARIAQLARAVGIHMIVATQRPSANIITGIIKANFPTRIAFKVASMIDSRTILDSPGANQLIGKGDMLISQGNQMVRVQCAFVDTPEVEQIVEFIEEQQSYPSAFMLPEYTSDEEGGSSLGDLGERDSLFEDVAKIVVGGQMGSTSMIQRKFSIGYNRAGRIMDQLEAAGIVGPAEGSKPRQVLISDEITLEQILSNED
ncbi:MAG: DNA translocase FtsK 4TM domain-containing protein [Bacteroidales bacterium]